MYRRCVLLCGATIDSDLWPMKVNDTERLDSYARFKVKWRPIDCVKMIPVSTRFSRYYGHGFMYRNFVFYFDMIHVEILLAVLLNFNLTKQWDCQWVPQLRLDHGLINPYKPGVPFLRHRQTVQTQIRCRRTRRLIRVYTITHRNFYQNMIKMKTVHQTPLKWKMDSSSR